jgi:hypothetical protein
VIGFIVYRLARKQFRSNRWWEWRGQAYIAVNEQFLVLVDRTQKLAKKEDDEANNLPPLYSIADAAQFRKEMQDADAAIRREIQRGQFLLSRQWPNGEREAKLEKG